MSLFCFVSTDEFWEAMGDPSFVRISKNQGRYKGMLLYVFTSPEDTDGFVAKMINEAKNNLGKKTNGRKQ